MSEYKDWRDNEVRSAVYNALAQISFEMDASKAEMEQAIEWFCVQFYDTLASAGD